MRCKKDSKISFAELPAVGSKIQRFKDSKIQGFKDLKIQRLASTASGGANAELPRFR
jgi:hypothetical protein